MKDWCKHWNEASRAVCYLVWNVITVGALLSPQRPTRVRGWRRMTSCYRGNCGAICQPCSQSPSASSDVTSPSSALGSKPPTLTQIARIFQSVNTCCSIQFTAYLTVQLFKKNFLQQFLSYIKLYSFFVVYVHYPFTPSLLLTQILKDFTKGFHKRILLFPTAF